MKKKKSGLKFDGAAPVCSCSYIPATAIVPRAWRDWFWQCVSTDAPFSWGDNDHSLVTARRFADHCEARLGAHPTTTRFLNKLRSYGDTYIDLEA